jgi:hypothetical protein
MGLDCILYKVTRVPDKLGDGGTTSYDSGTDTEVQILWDPDIKMLKELGLYTEDKTPILSYFKFEDDPNQGDYIELEYDYAVGSAKTNRFEVEDRKVLGHGEELVVVWVLAPMRVVPS